MQSSGIATEAKMMIGRVKNVRGLGTIRSQEELILRFGFFGGSKGV